MEEVKILLTPPHCKLKKESISVEQLSGKTSPRVIFPLFYDVFETPFFAKPSRLFLYKADVV